MSYVLRQGKRVEMLIDEFELGMFDDVRKTPVGGCALMSDLRYTKESITQRRAWQGWTNNAEYITRFAFGKNAAGDAYQLYGFGDNGSNLARIYSSSLGGTSWSLVTLTAQPSTGARARNVFFHWKDTVFFFENGTVLTRVNLTGTPTSTTEARTYTTVAQPVHHSADDYAYFFVDNVVYYKTTAAGALTTGITLPSNLVIIGGAEFGNLLAILASPIALSGTPGVADTILYLWDRNSVSTLFTEKINLGSARGVFIKSDENQGLWIVQNALRNSSLNGDESVIQIKHIASGSQIRTREIIRREIPSYFSDFTLPDASLTFDGNAEVHKGDLYFPIYTTTRKDSTSRHSILKVRRDNLGYALDRNVPSVTAGRYIDGIFQIQGSWYVAHSRTTTLSQGNSTTNTAIYEFPIINGGNSTQNKKLVSIGVMTEPISGNASVVLKYRADEETSFTTILTSDDANDVYEEAVNIQSSGAQLPQFRELQLELELTGAAVITGIKLIYEDVNDNPSQL